MDEEEKRVVHKVWKTVNKLLQQRGYNVMTKDLEITRQEFDDEYGDKYESRDTLSILATKELDENDGIFVFFPSDEKVAAKNIQDLQVKMKREDVNRAIVVIKNAITNHAKKITLQLKPEFIFEIFHQTELMVNIMEHSLVPPHIILTVEEKNTLLQRYTILESQLPRILEDDAVSRYLGLEVGQVVKIVRASETAGKYVTYRLVSCS